ncbi:hypothetical protein D3C87_650990 [compost metagenome]
MKIGFSFGRCIDDILNGRIAYEDVLVIVARTRIPTVEDIRPVVAAYVYERYINGSIDDATAIGERLFREGKLHQPRCFDARVTHVEHSGVWMDLAPTINTDNETVVQAWKSYQMLLRLTEENKPVVPEHIKMTHASQVKQKIDGPQKPLDDNF